MAAGRPRPAGVRAQLLPPRHARPPAARQRLQPEVGAPREAAAVGHAEVAARLEGGDLDGVLLRHAEHAHPADGAEPDAPADPGSMG